MLHLTLNAPSASPFPYKYNNCSLSLYKLTPNPPHTINIFPTKQPLALHLGQQKIRERQVRVRGLESPYLVCLHAKTELLNALCLATRGTNLRFCLFGLVFNYTSTNTNKSISEHLCHMGIHF